MLVNAFILACMSAAALGLTFVKLPVKIQQLLLKHPLFTDLATFGLTYITLGGSLTALFAGCVVGLVTSFMMHVHENKEKFRGVIIAWEWLLAKAKEFAVTADTWICENLAPTLAK